MVINVTMPKSWAELTDRQLRYLYFLLSAGYNRVQVQAYCLIRWGRLEDKGLRASQIAAVLPALGWLTDPPDVPVRRETMGKDKALYDPYCTGMTFETYLALDNLQQGFIHTGNAGLLRQMAVLLYDTDRPLTEEECVNIEYWYAGLKRYLARRFSRLFKPAEGLSSADLKADLQRAVDMQIRALTGGDITKNGQVLKADMYDALTELDARVEVS